jgi:hypothetical protein
MTELIGELRPVALADVDDDPSHAAAVGMQPDGRGPGRVLIDAQPRRLAVGKEAHAVEAGVAHAPDHLVRRARQHMPPIAGEFDRRREQRRRRFDRRRELRHGCESALHARCSGRGGAEDCDAGASHRFDKLTPPHWRCLIVSLIKIESFAMSCRIRGDLVPYQPSQCGKSVLIIPCGVKSGGGLPVCNRKDSTFSLEFDIRLHLE